MKVYEWYIGNGIYFVVTPSARVNRPTHFEFRVHTPGGVTGINVDNSSFTKGYSTAVTLHNKHSNNPAPPTPSNKDILIYISSLLAKKSISSRTTIAIEEWYYRQIAVYRAWTLGATNSVKPMKLADGITFSAGMDKGHWQLRVTVMHGSSRKVFGATKTSLAEVVDNVRVYCVRNKLPYFEKDGAVTNLAWTYNNFRRFFESIVARNPDTPLDLVDAWLRRNFPTEHAIYLYSKGRVADAA